MKSSTTTLDLQGKLDAQRKAYASEPYPSLATRQDRLARVGKLLKQHGEALARAVSADFGHRSTQETLLMELYAVQAALRHDQSHLKHWMAPKRVPTAWHFKPGRNELMPQPLGVVGVISPWNYPISLALTPVMAALAAGNRVMLKPSEVTERTSALMAKLVARFFAPDEFTVVLGGADVAAAFSRLRFDHLFFTGSTAVGRRVALAAAAQLVPVTLELGGKSPAIVDASAKLAMTCERLAYGKLMNAGQTCVAPDYVLAPHSMVPDLATGIGEAMKRLYPSVVRNPDYTSIVSDAHVKRLQSLIEDAKAQGATVWQPHDEATARRSPSRKRTTGATIRTRGKDARQFLPTIVTGVSEGMKLMQEEIFGPVLPIMGVDGPRDAISHVQRRERPLALYWFGEHAGRREQVLKSTHAGGVTINDCIWHLGQARQPFGGVGDSGQGVYHGEYGFQTFSSLKPVFTNASLSATALFRPPYGPSFEKLVGLLDKLT